MQKFRTIRQTARDTGLPEHHLRRLVKCGICPGFYAGSRFYINVDELTEQLERSCSSKETMIPEA